jgi:hypothetical protein
MPQTRATESTSLSESVPTPSALRPAKLRGIASGILADTLHHRQSTRSFAGSLGTHLFPFPLWRVLLRETRSFLGRMRAILETQLYRRLVVVDAGQLGLNWWERQRIQAACIADTSKLFAERPWLTLADNEIFVRAWLQGAEWYARNSDSSTRSSSLELKSSSPALSQDSARTETCISEDSSIAGNQHQLCTDK